MAESAFKPGARVARYYSGMDSTRYTEDVVEKVYKTGHFTLRSDPKQRWRPDHYGRHASQTGDKARWSREYAKIWDAETDAEISEQIARTQRRERVAAIRAAADKLKPDDISEDALTQIEAALGIPGNGRGT